MQTTKCFIFLAVIVIVFADGYGSNKGGGGRMGGAYEGRHKYGPFSYGYHDYHGNFVNVDAKHPHQVRYKYGFKAGGGGKSDGGYDGGYSGGYGGKSGGDGGYGGGYGEKSKGGYGGGYGGKSEKKYGGGYGGYDAYEDKNGDGYDGESAEGKY